MNEIKEVILSAYADVEERWVEGIVGNASVALFAMLHFFCFIFQTNSTKSLKINLSKACKAVVLEQDCNLMNKS